MVILNLLYIFSFNPFFLVITLLTFKYGFKAFLSKFDTKQENYTEKLKTTIKT